MPAVQYERRLTASLPSLYTSPVQFFFQGEEEEYAGLKGCGFTQKRRARAGGTRKGSLLPEACLSELSSVDSKDVHAHSRPPPLFGTKDSKQI